MIQTDTAYMSDPARAERTVRRFMNLTLREMKQMQDQDYVGYITDRLVSIEGLSPERLPDMPYIELACLIHNVGGQPRYDGYDYNSWDQQLVFYQCLAGILMDGNLYSIPVRLFMALPLKAFYAGLNHLMKYFGRIRRLCSYREGYTISDFLEEKTQKLTKAWQPTTPLDSYQKTIIHSLSSIGFLLVESFQTGLPL